VKVVVCVKQAIDVPGFVEFDDTGTEIDAAFTSCELNEADYYAVEEALRIQEATGEGEVVVLTAGNEESAEALRQCLALGAHRAIRVWSESMTPHDPISIARALAVAVRTENPDLVLCGVQSSDAGQQATGPALASALGVPCVSVATKVEVSTERQDLVVHREFQGGVVEVVETSRPAVVTVQTGLNTPRYGSFKGKLRAKKAEIPVVNPGEIGAPRARVRKMALAESDGGRDIEMIDGDPAAVAARIVELVREVGA
jgi:electron transfer flavoprotein beta subunit